MKRRWAFLVVTILLLPVSDRTVRAAPERPVVVIPGILGSKLCKKNTKTLVWGGAGSLSNLAQLALPLDQQRHPETFEVCGILDSVQVVGPFKFHQYDALLETLRGFGYAEGKTLFVFAYDWRRSNFDNARELAEYVKHNIGGRPYDIVAHSMGGVVARVYLSQYPSSEQVVRFVTMGTPHRGSLKVLRIADSGWSWWENALAGGIGQIRETLMTFPSVYELLPSYADCCVLAQSDSTSAGPATFNPLSAAIWDSLRLMPERFRSDEGRRFLRHVLQDAERLQAVMKAPIPRHVKFAPLVTGLVQTEWRTHLDPKSGTFVRWDSNFGDGTVYERSAANMQLFDARPSDVEHQRIFSSNSAREVLRWALLSGVDPTAGPLTTNYRATIKAGSRAIDVASLELSVTPELIKAGARGEFTLRIRGQRALAEVDVPVDMFLSGPQGALRLQTSFTVVGGDDLSTERIIRASFTAPADTGAHSLSAAVPGLEPLEELFEVIP